MNGREQDRLVDLVERYVLPPWPALAAGYICVVLAVALRLSGLASLSIPGQLLVGLGVLLGGWAVWMRLRSPWSGNKDQLHACVVLFAAAGLPLVAILALQPAWDSGTLILKVLAAVCGAGAILVLLPQYLRRVAVSLLAVYHFLGIALAATTLPVAGHPAPWLNVQLSTHFYQDYLRFMYLINAYHYYSPDPGAPTLLYFRVNYSNGAKQWVKIPLREQYPNRLEYQRRLGLTESTNDIIVGGMPVDVQFQWLTWRTNECEGRPECRALLLNEVERYSLEPFVRKPSPQAQMMILSYARFVARNYPYKDDPSVKVSSVKVYRVTHLMLEPDQFGAGADPNDPTTYFPFYQGEFDADGNLLENDGFMYTPLPSKWVPASERYLYMPDRNWVLDDDEVREFEDPDKHTIQKQVLVNRMKLHAEYMTSKALPK